jgi:DNA primase
MSDTVDEIKNHLDVVEVISSYIKLQKAGRNWKANCPFHNEKTPSFVVSPDRQIWHCFGCGLGGDIFTFVMKIEGIEFPDALRTLAQRAGVEIKKENPILKSKRKKLLEALEEAAEFFEINLKKSPRGKIAKEYLLKRKLTEETIKEFRVGYAPDKWQDLENHLTNRGYSKKEIFEAGLTVKKENNSAYDRFRDRIIFPIQDLQGAVIGFGGRVMPGSSEDKAKYINSPETFIYNKSRVLYNLHRAKVEIRKRNFTILVEGYMDVIASWQMKTRNVVASSGTALTEGQIKILKRYSENLAFSFDTDAAGQIATKRTIDLALEQGLNIKVITIPKKIGKDPADCLVQNPKTWFEAIKNKKPIMEFYFDSAFSGLDIDKVEDKKKAAAALLEKIKKIPNKIEQAHWINRLGQKIKIKEEILSDMMSSIRGDSKNYSNRREIINQAFVSKKNRSKILQERLLGFLLLWPKSLESLEKNLKADLFDNDEAEIFKILQKFLKNNQEFDFNEFKKELSLSLGDKIGYLTLKIENDYNLKNEDLDFSPESDLTEEMNNCLNELKKEKIKIQLEALEQDIKKAESEQDGESLKTFSEEFQRLSGELSEIKES